MIQSMRFVFGVWCFVFSHLSQSKHSVLIPDFDLVSLNFGLGLLEYLPG